jgi:hypothetical protein
MFSLFMRNVCLWIEFRSSIILVIISKVETIYSSDNHCQMIQHKPSGFWSKIPFDFHLYIYIYCAVYNKCLCVITRFKERDV